MSMPNRPRERVRQLPLHALGLLILTLVTTLVSIASVAMPRTLKSSVEERTARTE